MKKYAYYYDTLIGKIAIVADEEAVTNIYLEQVSFDNDYEIRETEIIKWAATELYKYFNKELQQFTVPCKQSGTDFQKSVYKALKEIPYGELRSYADIAKIVGSPKAYRAVGGANSRNPIPIIYPCHRVIGTSGKLVGFASGLDNKRTLLKIENITNYK